jgi:SnoaL-like domain
MTATEVAPAPASTEALFNNYHVGWETRNPDLIVSLHSADTVFHLHDGSEPVVGREALHHACTVMFETYHFTFEMGRRLFGERHWVFEWLMVLDLKDLEGEPFTAKVEMLDVVTLNDDDEVARKDVYMNGRQAQEAFARAGIAR